MEEPVTAAGVDEILGTGIDGIDGIVMMEESKVSPRGRALHEALSEVVGAGVTYSDRGQLEPVGAEAEKLQAVAKELRRAPDTAILIVGFAEPPAGWWKTTDLPEVLSLERAKFLKQRLYDLGCTNLVACEGAGHMDDKGARCEIRMCSAAEASEVEVEHFRNYKNIVGDAQRHVDSCLQGRELTFEPGYTHLKPECKEVVDELAEVVRLHPRVAFKIRGYTGRPGHSLTPTQAVCKDLSMRRAEVIKNLVEEQTPEATIGVEGLGHKDDDGARIEVVACDTEDFNHWLMKKSGGHLHYADWPASRGMEVVFEYPGGVGVKYTTFSRRPLGMVLGNFAPMTVVVVNAHGHAKELGIHCGMIIRMINGKSIRELGLPQAKALLNEAVARLPDEHERKV